MPQRAVLILNAGSSSLKFALYPAARNSSPRWRGKIDRLGSDAATLEEKRDSDSKSTRSTLGRIDHQSALRVVIDRSAGPLGQDEPVAIGHRVVHGGPHLVAPVKVNADVLAQLRAMEPYDPAHQSVELDYIEAAAKHWPKLPQVACFDTAFHHDLPEVARRMPVSRRDVERGVRRYGFHGLSYTHLLEALRRIGGATLADGRLILLHLGNGASAAAVRNGRCLDTTMGLTPTGGFPMSTRSGDIDPGVLFWLAREHGLSAETLFERMTRQSGLLAISETTADLRELIERERDDPRAAAAVDFFCHHLRKTIGAFAAVLGGFDVLVFTGGIGEHQPIARERICRGLEFLGLTLDGPRNNKNAPVISATGARVAVHVIPADEERVIANAVCDVLQPGVSSR